MSNTTETKSLQTILGSHGLDVPHGSMNYTRALENDARLAHEQREVIRKLARSIATLSAWVNTNATDPKVNHMLAVAFEAEREAQPYLD